MSTITIYTAKDTGDLKYLADVEDETQPDMALDAVLDEMPRVKDTEFLALVHEGDYTGHMVSLSLGDEPAARRPKRSIAVSNGTGVIADNEGDDDEEVEEAPAPKKTTARKRTPARKTTAAAAKRGTTKPAAKRTPARKPAAKKAASTTKKASGKRTPFTRSEAGDD